MAIKQAWEDRSLAEDRAATLQANHAEQGGDLARERQRRLGEQRLLPHTAFPPLPPCALVAVVTASETRCHLAVVQLSQSLVSFCLVSVLPCAILVDPGVWAGVRLIDAEKKAAASTQEQSQLRREFEARNAELASKLEQTERRYKQAVSPQSPLSVCLSVRLSACLSACLSVCLSFFRCSGDAAVVFVLRRFGAH